MTPTPKIVLRVASFLQSLDSSRRFLYASVLLSSVLFAVLCVNVPLALKPAAGHDDGLFLYHALSIASYQWLGDYSRLTLMKGPGYSIFLALVGLFRLPVALAHALLYALSAWSIAYLTSKLYRSMFFSLLVFEVLLWNFGPDTMRAIRDAIYTPLLLIAFACVALALFCFTGRPSIRAALGGGVAFGWFWMTREESITAMPILLLLFACSVYRSFHSRRSLRPSAKLLFSFLFGCFAVLTIVATINRLEYGVFTVVDIKGNFQQCLEMLQSVKPDVPVPYAPVPKSAREKIYRVSPTFAQLRTLLDGPNTPLEGWKKPGCSWYPDTCGDYAGGWFMWALRDAVSTIGGYSNARTASDFYRHVTVEVRRACQARTLSCSHTFLPYMPAIDSTQVAKIRASSISAVRRLTFLDLPGISPGESLGPDDQIQLAAWFLNTSNHTPPPALSVFVSNYRLTHSSLANRAAIIRLYSWFMPALLIAGLLSAVWVAGCSVYMRNCSVEFVIACAAWLGAALRVGALVMVDVSSFPGITNEYLGYAFPLASYAALLSIASAMCVGMGFLRKLSTNSRLN